MRIVIFCHSLLSDWNHRNAHFLRGVVTELLARGHDAAVHEPADAWSVENLIADGGEDALARFRAAYPELRSNRYQLDALDLDALLEGADLVIVHEWNDPELVRRIGGHRAHALTARYVLLFHDTHHRSVSDPAALDQLALDGFHGVLAFGEAVRAQYLQRGWAASAFTWHEAADVRVFRPFPSTTPEGDLVWIGNWGDEERSAELREFLLDPIDALGLRAVIHGVRYPHAARQEVARSGAEYAGWLPNFEVPRTFAAFRVTVHVPRRQYTRLLPGIPTIRPFEALACGIPLVCAPWDDVEGLFTIGSDYLTARNGAEMRRQLRAVLSEPELALSLARSGRETILRRHTCKHRVDELLRIHASLAANAALPAEPQATVAARAARSGAPRAHPG